MDSVWEQDAKRLEATLCEMLEKPRRTHLPKRSEGVHIILVLVQGAVLARSVW